MKSNRFWIAGALLTVGAVAHADGYSTDFETTPTSISGGADPRAPGNGLWWNPDNAATSGSIQAGVGLGGSTGLVIGNRGNGNDGVINNVTSARLNQAAGESTVAPNNYFESSYMFRTASATEDTGFAFKSETWGPDRTTWLGFFDDRTTHKLYADASGMIAGLGDENNAFDDHYLATNLDWGTWYRVKTSILFNDGANNDVVTQSIYDTSNNLLGSATLTDWETGAREYGYNGGQIFGVDAMGFQARNSTPGDTVYVDNVSYFSAPVPEPAPMAALGLGILVLFRRRARR